MEAADYKHTLTVREDAWFIRAYCWLWNADPTDADVCKLFWGYLFAIPNLIVRALWLLIWPLRRLGRRLQNWARRLDEWDDRRSRAPRDVPGQAAEFFARPWPRRVAKWTGIGALVGVAFVVMYWAAFGLVRLVPLIPVAFEETVAALGDAARFLVTDEGLHLIVAEVLGMLVGAALGVLIWYRLMAPWLKARRKRKLERGGMTFGDMLIAGARAVKTNTCPRLEVVDRSRKGGE